MAGCKCRYCHENLLTQNAYKIIDRKKNAYFCNEEHFKLFFDDFLRKKEEENAKRLLAAKEREEREAKIAAEKAAEKAAKIKAREEKEAAKREAIEKRKADKDKAYWLICDIIGRKEIINTNLWKEWAIWNKVATNEVIGNYLEENKNYLINVVSKIDDVEIYRINYLSAIIKNSLGDYKMKTKAVEKPQVKVDNTFYQPVVTNNNRRRSLADLEDEF